MPTYTTDKPPTDASWQYTRDPARLVLKLSTPPDLAHAAMLATIVNRFSNDRLQRNKSGFSIWWDLGNSERTTTHVGKLIAAYARHQLWLPLTLQATRRLQRFGRALHVGPAHIETYTHNRQIYVSVSVSPSAETPVALLRQAFGYNLARDPRTGTFQIMFDRPGDALPVVYDGLSKIAYQTRRDNLGRLLDRSRPTRISLAMFDNESDENPTALRDLVGLAS